MSKSNRKPPRTVAGGHNHATVQDPRPTNEACYTSSAYRPDTRETVQMAMILTCEVTGSELTEQVPLSHHSPWVPGMEMVANLTRLA